MGEALVQVNSAIIIKIKNGQTLKLSNSISWTLSLEICLHMKMGFPGVLRAMLQWKTGSNLKTHHLEKFLNKLCYINSMDSVQKI